MFHKKREETEKRELWPIFTIPYLRSFFTVMSYVHNFRRKPSVVAQRLLQNAFARTNTQSHLSYLVFEQISAIFNTSMCIQYVCMLIP